MEPGNVLLHVKRVWVQDMMRWMRNFHLARDFGQREEEEEEEKGSRLAAAYMHFWVGVNFSEKNGYGRVCNVFMSGDCKISLPGGGYIKSACTIYGQTRSMDDDSKSKKPVPFVSASDRPSARRNRQRRHKRT